MAGLSRALGDMVFERCHPTPRSVPAWVGTARLARSHALGVALDTLPPHPCPCLAADLPRIRLPLSSVWQVTGAGDLDPVNRSLALVLGSKGVGFMPPGSHFQWEFLGSFGPQTPRFDLGH